MEARLGGAQRVVVHVVRIGDAVHPEQRLHVRHLREIPGVLVVGQHDDDVGFGDGGPGSVGPGSAPRTGPRERPSRRSISRLSMLSSISLDIVGESKLYTHHPTAGQFHILRIRACTLLQPLPPDGSIGSKGNGVIHGHRQRGLRAHPDGRRRAGVRARAMARRAGRAARRLLPRPPGRRGHLGQPEHRGGRGPDARRNGWRPEPPGSTGSTRRTASAPPRSGRRDRRGRSAPSTVW